MNEEKLDEILAILKRMEARQAVGLEEIKQVQESTPIVGSFGTMDSGDKI